LIYYLGCWALEMGAMMLRKLVVSAMGAALVAMMALSFVGCGGQSNSSSEIVESVGEQIDVYQRAELGDADAQLQIGINYGLGKGVPQDYQKSCLWLEKAANQGNPRAQLILGSMYDEGNGVPKDHKKAYSWYEKAANQGDADAQYNLGVVYRDGNGVPQDYIKARSWYLKAANQGDSGAQYALSTLYALGNGVAKNYPTAYMWLNLASAKEIKYAEKRDAFVEIMTPAQIEEGQRLTREWLAQHPNLKN